MHRISDHHDRHWPAYLSLLCYGLLYFAFCIKGYTGHAEMLTVSGDGAAIVEIIKKNGILPFGEKYFHSWGPAYFLFVEYTLKALFDFQSLSSTEIWQWMQFIQFLFGAASLLGVYYILQNVVQSRATQAWLMLLVLANPSFLRYTFDVHPDIMAFCLVIYGIAFFFLSTKASFALQGNRSLLLFIAAAFCFGVGFLTKRIPIIFFCPLGIASLAVWHRNGQRRNIIVTVSSGILALGTLALGRGLGSFGSFALKDLSFFWDNPIRVFAKSVSNWVLEFFSISSFGLLPLCFLISFRHKARVAAFDRIIIFFSLICLATYILMVFTIFNPFVGGYSRYLFFLLPVVVIVTGYAVTALTQNPKMRTPIYAVMLIYLAAHIGLGAQNFFYTVVPQASPLSKAMKRIQHEVLDMYASENYVIGLDPYCILQYENDNLYTMQNSVGQSDFNVQKSDIIIINNGYRHFQKRVLNNLKAFQEPLSLKQSPAFEFVASYPAGKEPITDEDHIEVTLDVYRRKHLTQRVPAEHDTPPAESVPSPPPPAPAEQYEYTEPNAGIVFRHVKGGVFEQGGGLCTTDSDFDEFPSALVEVESFWIGVHEVTQGQWSAFMAENPSHALRGPQFPVESITRYDIDRFIYALNNSRLSKMHQLHFRLPTEAEWEYACRSGGQCERYAGTHADRTEGEVAWNVLNMIGTTHAVGTKKPNGLGIFDMSGNVWEWVSTPYKPYGEPHSTTGLGVIRGGGWNSRQKSLRCAARGVVSLNEKSNDIGFRLVVEPKKQNI